MNEPPPPCGSTRFMKPGDIHYRVHKSHHLSLLTHRNPFHVIASYFFLRSTLIISPAHRSSQRSIPFWFPHPNSSHACHMPTTSLKRTRQRLLNPIPQCSTHYSHAKPSGHQRSMRRQWLLTTLVCLLTKVFKLSQRLWISWWHLLGSCSR